MQVTSLCSATCRRSLRSEGDGRTFTPDRASFTRQTHVPPTPRAANCRCLSTVADE
jgi:hypothetical protein